MALTYKHFGISPVKFTRLRITIFSRSEDFKNFSAAGLVDVNISTPGKLDVNIVRNALRKNPELLKDNRFLQNVIVDENKADIFQKFLTENQLSSHAWVSGKKLVTFG